MALGTTHRRAISVRVLLVRSVRCRSGGAAAQVPLPLRCLCRSGAAPSSSVWPSAHRAASGVAARSGAAARQVWPPVQVALPLRSRCLFIGWPSPHRAASLVWLSLHRCRYLFIRVAVASSGRFIGVAAAQVRCRSGAAASSSVWPSPHRAASRCCRRSGVTAVRVRLPLYRCAAASAGEECPERLRAFPGQSGPTSCQLGPTSGRSGPTSGRSDPRTCAAAERCVGGRAPDRAGGGSGPARVVEGQDRPA